PDELGYLFSNVAAAESEIEIAGENMALRWDTPAEAVAVMQRVKERIKKRAPLRADALVAAIRGRLGVSAPNPMRILDRSAITDLGRRGVEFGSHTVSHALVGSLSPERVWREVSDSRECLNDILGSPPAGFCYPNGEPGDFTPATRELVKRAGYAYACTTVGGINRPGGDPFEIKRCWTGGLRLESFAFRLAFGRF
ncbi:MAG TPA: polysaccharide deacetylase family protein, partial [bacterium]|nr:polysaccharide deacetylase family protein [bacterium]